MLSHKGLTCADDDSPLRKIRSPQLRAPTKNTDSEKLSAFFVGLPTYARRGLIYSKYINPSNEFTIIATHRKIADSKTAVGNFSAYPHPPEVRSLFVHVSKLQLNNRIDWLKFLCLNCEHRQIIPTSKSCRQFFGISSPPRAVFVLREESAFLIITIYKAILRRKRVLFGSAYARRGLNCLW